MANVGWKAWSILLVVAWLVTTVHANGDYPPQTIAKAQRCPVCGMYPANYPKWHAQIVFKNGDQAAFDSAAEMFRYINDISKYDKRHSSDDIGNIYVQNYSDGGWLLGKDAYFVIGSKVKGPMGNDLPAFANEAAAVAFIEKSGGKVMRFEQIDIAVISSLRNPMLNGEGSHNH